MDTWYQHAEMRVLWYSHDATYDPRLTDALRLQNAALSLRSLASLSPGQGAFGIWLETDNESDLHGVDWQKTTNAPAGVASITLLPRQNYKNMIQPGDVLFLFGKAGPDDKEHFITLLSVDSVGETTQVADHGATTDLVNIAAQDFGKYLTKSSLVFDSLTASQRDAKFLEELWKPYIQKGASRDPGSMVQYALHAFFSAVAQDFGGQRILEQWRFPGVPSVSMFSLLDTRSFVQVPMYGACFPSPAGLQAAGNMWALLAQYANTIVNEFFVDVRDLIPEAFDAQRISADIVKGVLGDSHGSAEILSFMDSVASDLSQSSNVRQERVVARQNTRKAATTSSVVAMVHRQLPYDTAAFMALPAVALDETEVFTSDLKRSDHDVYNYFRVRFPGFDASVQDGTIGHLMNRASIMKHGLRKNESSSIFILPSIEVAKSLKSGVNQADILSAARYYTFLLATWHAFNERMLAGAIQCRLRPDIRVGYRLVYTKSRGTHAETIDLYIQGVHHHYGPQPGTSRTTLTLVRGVERLADPAPESYLLFSPKHRTSSNPGMRLLKSPYELIDRAGIRRVG